MLTSLCTPSVTLNPTHPRPPAYVHVGLVQNGLHGIRNILAELFHFTPERHSGLFGIISYPLPVLQLLAKITFRMSILVTAAFPPCSYGFCPHDLLEKWGVPRQPKFKCRHPTIAGLAVTET